MTNAFGSVCAQIAILVSIFGSTHSANITHGTFVDHVEKSDRMVATEDHDYYRSQLYVNKEETAQIRFMLHQVPENRMPRRQMTFQLSFDFPFYGHHVRNVTVSEEGYISTGEDGKLRWGITQYIAPLMRKFDKSLSNDSFVRVQDNGTSFNVVWESVMLRDRPIYGKFTFSATLHQNGDIVFVYYQLPTLVNNIQESYRWVKIGLSDAYILDWKKRLFGPDMSFYMYHKVDLVKHNLQNSTIIRLTALPTCLGYKDCHSCINHNTKFECAWCPAVNRCSTRYGTDPLKQDWMGKGCNNTLISTSDRCPAVDPTDSTTSQPTPTSTEDSINNPKLSTVQLTNLEILGMVFSFLSIICLVLAATLISFHAYRNAKKLKGNSRIVKLIIPATYDTM